MQGEVARLASELLTKWSHSRVPLDLAKMLTICTAQDLILVPAPKSLLFQEVNIDRYAKSTGLRKPVQTAQGPEKP